MQTRHGFLLGLVFVTGIAAPVPLQAQVIASGTLRLTPDGGQAAANVANLEYRQFTARHAVPGGLGRTVGRTVVVTLRDATRQFQGCPAGPQQADVMLNGCAAINWPDSTRPSFSVTNRLRLPISPGGNTDLHLRINRGLSARPEPPAD